MATKDTGNFEPRYHCVVNEESCKCDVPRKIFIQEHLADCHVNCDDEFELRYHCLKANCRFITSKKIKMTAHLQVFHGVEASYQSVHLKQIIKTI